MKNKDFNGMLNNLRNTSLSNINRTGHKEKYQVLREGFYEIINRRKLSLAESFLAIYLRGKSCHYGNPFKLPNSTIYHELATTREIIDKVKASLQIKGVIKYSAGKGIIWTEYTMLDSIMIQKNHR